MALPAISPRATDCRFRASKTTAPGNRKEPGAALLSGPAGWLTSGIDQNDMEVVAVRNPRANIGDPLNPGNKNFMLYSGRQPLLAGSNLALHVGRWLSLLMAALTLWFVYLTPSSLCGRHCTFKQTEPGIRANAKSAPLLRPAPARDGTRGRHSAVSLYQRAVQQRQCDHRHQRATIYWLARLLSRIDRSPRPGNGLCWGCCLTGGVEQVVEGLGLVPVVGLVVFFLAWRREWKFPCGLRCGRACRPWPSPGGGTGATSLSTATGAGFGHLMAINAGAATTSPWRTSGPEFKWPTFLVLASSAGSTFCFQPGSTC